MAVPCGLEISHMVVGNPLTEQYLLSQAEKSFRVFYANLSLGDLNACSIWERKKKQKFRMAPDLNVHVFNYFPLNENISWLSNNPFLQVKFYMGMGN